MTLLTGKKRKFEVTPEVVRSFEALKEAMKNFVLRSTPDPKLPFIIYTDASDGAVGASLVQEHDNERRIIHLISRKLSDAECKWSTTEREAFGVLWALESFDRYIRGSPIVIKTDHQALLHLKNSTVPKLVRWGLRIATYAPVFLHTSQRLRTQWSYRR